MTKLGFEPKPLDVVQGGDRPALRHGAGHRPHRLGQDDDAVLGARGAQQGRRRTSPPPRTRSSSTCRHQPGADARRHRPELRRGAALASCARTPTSSWSARSATSRPRRSRSRPRSPATWCSRRCTPTTRPATVTRLLNMGIEPFLVTASVNLHPRPAPRAQDLRRLQEAGDEVDDAGARSTPGVPPSKIGTLHARTRGRGCRDVQRHRLQGPRRALRGHAASATASRSWCINGASAAELKQEAIRLGHADAAHVRRSTR